MPYITPQGEGSNSKLIRIEGYCPAAVTRLSARSDPLKSEDSKFSIYNMNLCWLNIIEPCLLITAKNVQKTMTTRRNSQFGSKLQTITMQMLVLNLSRKSDYTLCVDIDRSVTPCWCTLSFARVSLTPEQHKFCIKKVLPISRSRARRRKKKQKYCSDVMKNLRLLDLVQSERGGAEFSPEVNVA